MNAKQTLIFQAEDGIRDRSPSRGLGDVYKRQHSGYNPIEYGYYIVALNKQNKDYKGRFRPVSYTHLTLPTTPYV